MILGDHLLDKQIFIHNFSLGRKLLVARHRFHKYNVHVLSLNSRHVGVLPTEQDKNVKEKYSIEQLLDKVCEKLLSVLTQANLGHYVIF